MKVQIPWTFKTWLAEFKGVDLPIGDFAEYVSNEPDFPVEDSFGIIHEYLCETKADIKVIETFAIVWNFYWASTYPSHLDLLLEQYQQ